MAITTKDLIQRIRVDLDDVVEPYLISDGHIINKLNEAQIEFVEQTLCLFSASDSDLNIPLSKWTTVPDSVLRIRAISTADGTVIRPVTLAEMEYGYAVLDSTNEFVAKWRGLTGTPRFAVVDMEQGKIRLVPSPTAVIQGQLEAFIKPKELSDIEEPSISDRWRKDLVPGALVRIYAMQDTELYDPEAVQRYAQEWEKALVVAVETLERGQRDITRRFRLPRTLERNTSVLTGRSKSSVQQQKIPAKANGNNATASS